MSSLVGSGLAVMAVMAVMTVTGSSLAVVGSDWRQAWTVPKQFFPDFHVYMRRIHQVCVCDIV